eukprot:11166555-Lingulodinium_polyedra.AAC.1
MRPSVSMGAWSAAHAPRHWVQDCTPEANCDTKPQEESDTTANKRNVDNARIHPMSFPNSN